MWFHPSVCHTVVGNIRTDYISLMGNKSTKPGEVWKNKCDLGRTKRLFNKRHSNKGQAEKQMHFVLSFSCFTLSTVL